jgi:hypothetical protein
LEGGFIGQPENLIGPYVRCVNEARIIIRSAYLMPSNRDECPLQYIGTNIRTICESRLHPDPIDVTNFMKARYA